VNQLLQRRVLLVTGKGGVGRTTVAASIALAAAAAGKRVLLADIGVPGDTYSPLARLFHREALPREPDSLRDGVFGVLLWPRAGHERFLRDVVRLGPLVKVAMASRALGRFLDAAPSLNEMGLFYHFLELVRQRRDDGQPRHEMLILDMPATGHTLALATLPEALLRLLPTGPIAEALREGQGYLYDARSAAALVVTLPEALPVTEAVELVDGLRGAKLPVGAVIVNKWIDDEFDATERELLTDALEPTRASGVKREVYGAARFAAVGGARREVERVSLATGAPILRLPEVPAQGDALLDALAASFATRGVAE
jgi:anion-transporting  ArsA/GET3 family ATPase